MNLKSINCVILNFLLAFCLNISFAQDQKITPLSKDSKSVEKPKKGTLKSSVSINPDELVYTGIIYIKCGK